MLPERGRLARLYTQDPSDETPALPAQRHLDARPKFGLLH